MILVQIAIHVPGNDNNTIQIDILEREDANDIEREMAKNIQALHLSILNELRDRLPAGEVEISVIDRQ